MAGEPPRSRAAREAAERALARVVHHYGTRPEFVVLGGLVPELLCSRSSFQHAGTTDIDVQVDLEIACGALHTERLERALRSAAFEPDGEFVWRWREGRSPAGVRVRFELLADLETAPAGASVRFDGCDSLGAANLRGTGFASRDHTTCQLRARVGGGEQVVEVYVAGLAGFLLAKCAAAHSRRKPKDWYDIAFVLLHNDAGGPEAAAAAVLDRFGDQLASVRTALDDLVANFANPDAQGPRAYAQQMAIDHPEIDRTTVRADAIVAVEAFCRRLKVRGAQPVRVMDETPGGTLHLVATPIGNLEDVTLRALRVLREAGLVLAEDTRRTRILLDRHGIAARPLSLHAHNEAARTAEVLAALAAGRDVALVSDAGTPLVSDPGERLVAAAIAAGHPVAPVPGPSAVLAALAGSGLPPVPFAFLGFAPRRAAERAERFAAFRERPETLVLFESPHRLAATLRALAEALGPRPACVARELTKLHEEWARGTLAELATRFAGGTRGEVTIVVGGAPPGAARAPSPDQHDEATPPPELEARITGLRAEGLRAREIAAVLAKELGCTRREAYALVHRQGSTTPDR